MSDIWTWFLRLSLCNNIQRLWFLVILFSLRFPLKNKQTKNRHPEPVEKNMSLSLLCSLSSLCIFCFSWLLLISYTVCLSAIQWDCQFGHFYNTSKRNGNKVPPVKREIIQCHCQSVSSRVTATVIFWRHLYRKLQSPLWLSSCRKGTLISLHFIVICSISRKSLLLLFLSM